jgi:hypothetical protein
MVMKIGLLRGVSLEQAEAVVEAYYEKKPWGPRYEDGCDCPECGNWIEAHERPCQLTIDRHAMRELMADLTLMQPKPA